MKIFKQALFLAQGLLLTTSLQCFAEEVENIEDDLIDSSLEDLLGMETELKADIGSRSGARNFLESRSPLDVITFDQIDRSGLTSLTDVLRYFVAGFNAPENSKTDGSDHVQTFTLRGMSPDQILVLVNGKRLHTSALLHVNTVIGRGSSHTDLNTIAVQSIEKIEILRDGAAAQYGSDAIAGVINIILKGVGHKNSISVSGGARAKGDGEQYDVNTFLSLPLKYEGFANLTLSMKGEGKTQRAGADRRLEIPEVKTHVGVPKSENFLATFNAEMPLRNDMVLYSHGLFDYRNSEASAFYRTPDPDRALSPEGFLPMINAEVIDYSITAGVNGEIGDGYFWDMSNIIGYNSSKVGIDNTMNYALGMDSPRSFAGGQLEFLQNTFNADLTKTVDSFDISGGFEYRYENYQIHKGDELSYVDKGTQGLSGFLPDNEADKNRHSYALYTDIVYNFNDDLSFEGAGRFEDYSDFGSTINGKLSMGYKVISELLLRTSASTGFRAPSLAQSSYSQTVSGLLGPDGQILTKGIFTPDHVVSQALGAKPLKAETSKHITAGFVYQPINDMSFIVDYFFTAVDDRIMLSNDLEGTTEAQKAILAENGVAKARFFNNAVNTETQGVDVKFNYQYTFENDSVLDFGTWFNYTQNKVTGFNEQHITRENSFAQIDRMENGQPKTALKFLTHYQFKPFDITLNLNRFGEYQQVTTGKAFKFDAAWTVDLDVSYQILDNMLIAVGGTNIFNETANKWKELDGVYYGTNGFLPYSQYAPFGYSGGYYYLRTTFEF